MELLDWYAVALLVKFETACKEAAAEDWHGQQWMSLTLAKRSISKYVPRRQLDKMEPIIAACTMRISPLTGRELKSVSQRAPLELREEHVPSAKIAMMSSTALPKEQLRRAPCTEAGIESDWAPCGSAGVAKPEGKALTSVSPRRKASSSVAKDLVQKKDISRNAT